MEWPKCPVCEEDMDEYLGEEETYLVIKDGEIVLNASFSCYENVDRHEVKISKKFEVGEEIKNESQC